MSESQVLEYFAAGLASEQIGYLSEAVSAGIVQAFLKDHVTVIQDLISRRRTALAQQPYMRLRLHGTIDGARTVGQLAARGCPTCSRRLVAEGSSGFGLLRCPVHGTVWQWIPTFRETDGKAPTAWKNHVTGERSKEWKKRWGSA